MIEELKKVLKDIEGRIIAFGFRTEKFESIINSNKKIISLDVFDEISKKTSLFHSKSKKIKIKRLRKIYKKKNVDYVIINADEFLKYTYDLVIETIYIAKKVYIFGSDINVKKFMIKYKRYNISCVEKRIVDNTLCKLDVENVKNNPIKEYLYKIKDKFAGAIDFVVEVLTS